ncbi:Methionine aminopeptidase [uncultured archaeon]|nr:Methionine aminopeptidase [uncultured archaeon]
MTEKSYGGNNGIREHVGGNTGKVKDSSKINITDKKSKKPTTKISTSDNSSLDELDSYKKAGEIAKEVVAYAKDLIKPDMLLVEIAKKIDAKIESLGGGIAFPVNLSIDDIAAHYHPTLEDQTKAYGLLKVDIGIHVNGFIADTAFSLDLTSDKKYKDLIKASEDALEAALSILEKNPTINDIGEAIQVSIQKKGFSPVVNLSGHELGPYTVHAGITIPNHANASPHKIESGAYAIEPFATTGEGKIYEGAPSNIYQIITPKNTRGETARKILEYVWEKYETLPFSLREIQEKFGGMSRLAIKELEQNKIIHSYPQLIEVSHKPVSQAEHTFVKTPDGKIIVTTK